MDLTVVLPLRNRSEFTDRFLRYCDAKELRVVVADGSDTPQNFAAKYRFASYHYYEPDRRPADYWAKMAHVFKNYVHTRYAIVCDNDDFPMRFSLSSSVAFLDTHPDYVCHSGRIAGFHLFGPSDCLSSYNAQYSPYDTPADYGDDDTSKRVLRGFANSWSYFAVYRARVLGELWAGAQALDFRNFSVHEKYMAIDTLVKGKAKCDAAFVSVYRQYGTSIQSAKIFPSSEEERLTDMRKVLAVAGAQGVDAVELRRRWLAWQRSWQRRTYGWPARLRKAAKAKAPWLASLYQNRHRTAFWQRPIWQIINES